MTLKGMVLDMRLFTSRSCRSRSSKGMVLEIMTDRQADIDTYLGRHAFLTREQLISSIIFLSLAFYPQPYVSRKKSISASQHFRFSDCGRYDVLVAM